MKIFCFAVGLIFFAVTAQANDSAVETAVGGLKLRREHSVLMEKERLFISKEVVRVEYLFRNTSEESITSEVAFPIPAFAYVFDDRGRSFSDFKAWIDGKPVHVDKEVRAYVNGQEVTDDLCQAGINIENFGYFSPDNDNNEIKNLNPEIRNRLVEIGALTPQNIEESSMSFWPNWTTEMKYHWSQTFPPGTGVRIKHEYQPGVGYSGAQVTNCSEQVSDSCISERNFSKLKKRVLEKTLKDPNGVNYYFFPLWVSYILTTANTWQTPIMDFELVVQGDKDEIVAFCWDGPIKQTGVGRYKVQRTNFVPSKELKVYFIRY